MALSFQGIAFGEYRKPTAIAVSPERPSGYNDCGNPVLGGLVMKVSYSEKAKERGEGFALLQQVTERLEEVVRRFSGEVKAEWDRTDRNGHSLYTLRLSDRADSASASFAPEELRPSHELQIRLYRLWDALLKARSERLLQELGKDEK